MQTEDNQKSIDEATAVIHALSWECKHYHYFNLDRLDRASLGDSGCPTPDRIACGRIRQFFEWCNCRCHMVAAGKSENEWPYGEAYKK